MSNPLGNVDKPQGAKQGLGPVTAVIVGAGHRAVLYASYAEKHPDELRIVGVVDPDPVRLQRAGERFGVAPGRMFASLEAFVQAGRIADAVINGTMDTQHVPTTLPLLAAGYDVLLEKPIGVSADEVTELLRAAQTYGRKVIICHVLRYAPFYAEIRKRVLAGEIGDIIAMQTSENVSYHHMAMGFVRGKWNRKDRQSSMLMAKCCHDLDLIAWMKGGIDPVRVSSFGSRQHFRPEMAPEGAGTRCLLDCRIEETCPYSAKKHYIEQGLWGFYVWSNQHLGITPTPAEQLEQLRTDNPYGRCVWHCDNDVVDHQAVIVQFADGSTATHNMIGGTAKPCRSMHLVGTKGEIQGVMEEGAFVVRKPDPRKGHVYEEEIVNLSEAGDMHGGGDLRLVADFVRMMRGQGMSISSAALEISIYGHLIGFAADRSMERGELVELPKL